MIKIALGFGESLPGDETGFLNKHNKHTHNYV